MLNEFSPDQPAVQSLVQRISDELTAKAVLLIHENGQVLHRSGWIDEDEYPSFAALVAAMISAGKSLERLSFEGTPTKFSCDSEAMGLYTVAVTPEIWLAVLFEQPLNPGHFRMKVRKYSELLSRIGVQKAEQWEVTETVTSPGANMRPVASPTVPGGVILTPNNSSLFVNITDAEIDELFENASS